MAQMPLNYPGTPLHGWGSSEIEGEGSWSVTCEALTTVLLTPYREMERWRCRRLVCCPLPLAFACALFWLLLLLVFMVLVFCCWFWLLAALLLLLLLLSSWFWWRWQCLCLVGSMGLSGKFNSVGQVSRLSSMNVEFCCGCGAILSPGGNRDTNWHCNEKAGRMRLLP